MLALAFFSWWYGSGWKLVSKKTLQTLDNVLKSFSVSLLIKTLFMPWRRIITYPGSGIAAHLQAIVDNTVSRFIGFLVRIFVLLAALVVVVCLALVGFLQLVIWPLLPIAAMVCLIMGFFQ